MICPSCNGKLQVLDSVNNNVENETYRLKKCIVCNKKFFTVEYEVIQNARFDKDWSDNYRHTNKKGNDT